MYRTKDIKESWSNLLGWRQASNPSDFIIEEDLTVTETGQYYQDIHPLITLGNIKAVAPEFDTSGDKNWLIDIPFTKGQVAIWYDKTYMALEDSVGKVPPSYTETWLEFDRFSDWLRQKTEASILNAVRSFWTTKVANRTARGILESKALFNGVGRLADLVPNDSNLVGFELDAIQNEGLTIKIDKIGLQFDGPGVITLYIFHSSRNDPIRTIALEYNRTSGIEWFPIPDLYLPHTSAENDGGAWYLVYKQDEMEGFGGDMLAVNKIKNWEMGPCGSCDRAEVAAWRIWSKYLSVHPFKLPSNGAGGLWDVDNMLYTYNTNYGLNLQISIECDITDMLINQRIAFQNIVGLQMAADMLREFAYNPNFNISRVNQNLDKREILYELDGDSQGDKESGIAYQLEKAMEAMSLDLSSMHKICLPCGKRGIRYRAI
jgi:hypothetical protein